MRPLPVWAPSGPTSLSPSPHSGASERFQFKPRVKTSGPSSTHSQSWDPDIIPPSLVGQRHPPAQATQSPTPQAETVFLFWPLTSVPPHTTSWNLLEVGQMKNIFSCESSGSPRTSHAHMHLHTHRCTHSYRHIPSKYTHIHTHTSQTRSHICNTDTDS